MRRNRNIVFSLAIICILMGCTLYILYRPTTLLMFHWVNHLGLADTVGSMRAWSHASTAYLPKWAVFSLPFALWVLSYQLFIVGIWYDEASALSNMWIWCVPTVAILAEMAQFPQIVPGRFDIFDLMLIVLATLLGKAISDSVHQTKEYLSHEQ